MSGRNMPLELPATRNSGELLPGMRSLPVFGRPHNFSVLVFVLCQSSPAQGEEHLRCVELRQVAVVTEPGERDSGYRGGGLRRPGGGVFHFPLQRVFP